VRGRRTPRHRGACAGGQPDSPDGRRSQHHGIAGKQQGERRVTRFVGFQKILGVERREEQVGKAAVGDTVDGRAA
jgi:hypothetical protein